MFEVTESALTSIKDYISQEKIDSPIRITKVSGGCAGPSLGLAIDDNIKENDKTFDYDGVSFVVEDSLFTACGATKVDYIEKSDDACGCGSNGSFAITSERPLSGSSCGCSCNPGSCG